MSEEKVVLEDIIYEIMPSLNSSKHKGSDGRIGVVGGSENYTGAPYFSAITAYKLGADIVYNFCCSSAAIPLKCFAPEIMAIPILDSSNAIEEFSKFLPKIKSLLIGPGLGNNEILRPTILSLIKEARKHNINLVLDAEGIHFIQENPEIIKNYKRAILTPNIAEYRKLYKKCLSQEDCTSNESVRKLSSFFEGVTIIRKGAEDIITDGSTLITCNEEGSNRRCGGQGDILAGATSCFNLWAHSNLDNKIINPSIAAALAACKFTRCCNRLAFSKLGRSTLTTDMIKEIPNVIQYLFPKNFKN